MNQPNPFDFSDFGPARQPTGPNSPAGPTPGAARPSGGDSGEFDPFANQPGPAPQQPHRDAFGPTTGPPPSIETFGGPAAVGGNLQTAGPPLMWFAIAVVLALLGLIAAAVGAVTGGSLVTAATGWLLAGPVAIGALAMYTRVDTRRRTEAIYSAPVWAARLYWVVLALCLIGIALGAWQIALWAGRQ